MIEITLKNNTHWKNKYSVFVKNEGVETEARFSHASKARKYVRDFFEPNEVSVIDDIVEPIKRIKEGIKTMREIKFRAWDKECNRMTRFHLTHGDSYGIGGDIFPHFEIMQFTGLKDKNGKEIYEGDIVIAYSQGQKGTFEVKWRQESSPCYILYPAWQNRIAWHISATEHYKGKQFIGVDAKIETTDKEGYYDEGLEIIGNIYENPDLLTQKP